MSFRELDKRIKLDFSIPLIVFLLLGNSYQDPISLVFGTAFISYPEPLFWHPWNCVSIFRCLSGYFSPFVFAYKIQFCKWAGTYHVTNQLWKMELSFKMYPLGIHQRYSWNSLSPSPCVLRYMLDGTTHRRLPPSMYLLKHLYFCVKYNAFFPFAGEVFIAPTYYKIMLNWKPRCFIWCSFRWFHSAYKTYRATRSKGH